MSGLRMAKKKPFSFETKITATLHRDANTKQLGYTKRTTEELTNRCSHILNGATKANLNDTMKMRWQTESAKFSSSGLLFPLVGFL